MREISTQKYINTDLHSGDIKIEKSYMGNYIDMIRTMPNTTRILMLVASYADYDGVVYVDSQSIQKLLNINEKEDVIFSLLTLFDNGWIDIDTIKVENKDSIKTIEEELAKQDLNTYYVNTEIILDAFAEHKINRVTLNTTMISSSGSSNNNLVFPEHNKVFYDKDKKFEDNWGVK